jgi:hypothetical protein
VGQRTRPVFVRVLTSWAAPRTPNDIARNKRQPEYDDCQCDSKEHRLADQAAGLLTGITNHLTCNSGSIRGDGRALHVYRIRGGLALRM